MNHAHTWRMIRREAAAGGIAGIMVGFHAQTLEIFDRSGLRDMPTKGSRFVSQFSRSR
jgi:hypothetical protein